MPSPEVLAVLADEVAEVAPQLADALARLADGANPARAEAMELYREPVERIAGTAELLGLDGLQEFCAQLEKNLAALDTGIPDERLRALLNRWPGLLIGYLRAPQDGVYSRELADYLREDGWPVRMDAVQAAGLVQKLSAIANHDDEEENQNRRPTEARPEDVDLAIDEEVNPALVDSFLAEAPLQAGAYTSIVENVIRGGAGPGVLNEARRLIHSIKGAANTVGVRGVAQLTHHLEDLLEYLAQHSITPQGPVAKLLMDAADCLEMMFETLVSYEPEPAQAQSVLQRLLDVANDIDAGKAIENVAEVKAPEEPMPADDTASVGAPIAETAGGGIAEEEVPAAEISPTETLGMEVPDIGASSEDTVAEAAPAAEASDEEAPATEISPTEALGMEIPDIGASSEDTVAEEAPAAEASDEEAPATEISQTEPFGMSVPDTEASSEDVPAEEAANADTETSAIDISSAEVVDIKPSGEDIGTAETAGQEPFTVETPDEIPGAEMSATAVSDEKAETLQVPGEEPVRAKYPGADLSKAKIEDTETSTEEVSASGSPDSGTAEAESPSPDVTAAESPAAKSVDTGIPPAGAPKPEAPVARTEPQAEAKVPSRATPEVKRAIRVAADTIEELLRLSSEMTIGRSHIQERLHQAFSFTGELRERQSMLQNRTVELDRIVTVQGVAAGQKLGEAGPGGIFDALEMDQYSELHGAVHGIVETVADVQTIGTRVLDTLEAIETAVTQQGLVNTELHEQIMRARMVPASNIEPRLARVVRQACDATGKQARLVFTGGDVMLDDHVVNEVINPLSHLLRNAVDHGIETPQARIASRKPEVGEIRLSFVREGNHIVIRCSDDGAGLDLTHIHGVAVQRGMIPEDAELNDAQITRLILLPGFSTRSQVSEVSGRGVGMDVVNAAMEKLKGTIDITSDPGAGCHFTLRLPLTLGSAHCLLVNSGGLMSAIPTDILDRVVYTGASSIERLGKSWVYREDRDTIEAFDLADLLGYPVEHPLGQVDDSRPVVVVTGTHGKQAVVVDQLLSGRDLVIKSLGRFLNNARGVVGASLLGDGTVLPVLDMHQLLDQSQAGIGIPGVQAIGSAAKARAALTDILVVDDSLSVRQALSQLLEDEGYQVHTAKDGVEALEYLDNERPAAMLVDLEMPRMNGLELTQRLRERDGTRNLPVIMITSRTSDKHRTQAQIAGVDLYLTKPYREVDLLARLRSMLSKAA